MARVDNHGEASVFIILLRRRLSGARILRQGGNPFAHGCFESFLRGCGNVDDDPVTRRILVLDHVQIINGERP